MAARIIVGSLAIARLALAAVDASPRPYDPISTHAAQFDLNLVGEEFEKAGFGSTIEPAEPLASVNRYTGPIAYGNVAINAPFNCLGQNTHEGSNVWLDGLFDPNRCADACTYKTESNLEYGLQDRVCRFFNTYILKRNGVDFAQYCSLNVNASKYKYKYHQLFNYVPFSNEL
ncbi:hypothetical protein ANO14919_086790 [Xylariales sp. No.14919]|nr:hypothetical protein ANO14919_086790 [Xylariales sp. No.14919]